MKKIVWLLVAFTLCASIGIPAAAANTVQEDTAPPNIQLEVYNDILTVTVKDTYSGVSSIYVGHEYFSGNAGTTLSIPLQTYAREEHIYIYAVDNAGNVSNTTVVKNPYYTGNAGTIVGEVTTYSIRPSDGTISQSGEKSAVTGSGTSELVSYPISMEADGDGYIYYYAIGLSQSPDSISHENMTIEGASYKYDSTAVYDVFVIESMTVTEQLELASATRDTTDVLSSLEKTMEYSENGYKGTLHLDIGAIGVEDGERQNYSYTDTQTREYPGLSFPDSSEIPKSITHNGVTYELASLDFSESGYETVDYMQIATGYTGYATYTRSGYGSKVVNYDVSAVYTGTVSGIDKLGQIYAVRFAPMSKAEPADGESGEPSGEALQDTVDTESIEDAESSSPKEKGSSAKNSVLLIVIIAVVLAAGGATVFFFIKKRREYEYED